MEAIIINFRRGRHTQKPSHAILEVPKVETKKDSAKFLNKNVFWTSPAGKVIKGIIKAQHGTKGALRAIFEKGLPGQAIGAKAKIE
ncbi:50S ribosomal protein L35ae [Candidatus Woesearchaeota archaeon]|nr:50S ribosomal protein L35ae [Candidatus Woesearchaeota archaeon]